MEISKANHARGPVPRPRRKNILIADDDPDIHGLVGPALRREGYRVIALPSGAALMDHLGTVLLESRRAWPDLIITDFCMPGFTGIEVLAGLRRADWSVPIVVITAIDDLHVSEQAHKHGATAFLRKPFTPSALVGIVHGIVRAQS